MISSPVFILGSERSGTNLLRVLLSNHSRLHGPVSPHFLHSFANSARYYSPLSDANNAKMLFNDMLAVANHPYTGWDLSLEFEYAVEKYQPVAFLDFFNLFYMECARLHTKDRFVCKEIYAWEYLFQVLAYYPRARIIYLHRDPRDYVASWVSKPLFIATAFDAATAWAREQDLIEDLIRVHGIKMHIVRYEDLIGETEATMKGILEYVDLPIEPECFETNSVNGRRQSWNPYWENLDKPVIRDNSGKHKSVLNEKTINMVERIASHHMKMLGYAIRTKADWKRPRFKKLLNGLERILIRLRHRCHIKRRMKKLHEKISLISSQQARIRHKYYTTRNL